MELVILIGLQASGKTTFYHERLAATHVHVSKDAMRNVKNKIARQQRLITEALTEGRSVAVDNTNPSITDRAPLIALGKACGATVVGYYFASNLTSSLEFNRLRTGKACVPDVALYVTAKKLELPSYAEGFDRLWYVCMDPAGGFEVEMWKEETGEDE